MYRPSFEEATELSPSYGMIPVSRTMYADIRTPIEVLRCLKAHDRHCFMLESMEDKNRWGRYTFLGFAPKLEITCANGAIRVTDEKTVTFPAGSPADAIRRVVEENRSPRFSYLPPFTGGLVGYFAYDYIQYAEPSLTLNAKDAEGFQNVDLMLFDRLIVFDNLTQQITLIANMKTDAPEQNYHLATEAIEEMAALIKAGTQVHPAPLQLKTPFTPLFQMEAFCAKVERAKHYIHEGDIFQVVLSNRLEAEAEGSLFDAYRVLRSINPSPYMFYFSSDDIEIAGASPETLVKLQDGTLFTFPLAGTRPRGQTPEEDARLERELLQDEKELAEHNMLVDLGRNDIGRISEFGTVKVEKYLSVERFSHVMHIGSTVKGTIRQDQNALDAIGAVLPAGTLSGAPKLRACEIIDELEDNKRGIYGGAVGYIDFTGNMDTCIAIRMAYKKNSKVFVRSGAGIVADSVPESEYQECINKAHAVVHAVELSEGGIDA